MGNVSTTDASSANMASPGTAAPTTSSASANVSTIASPNMSSDESAANETELKENGDSEPKENETELQENGDSESKENEMELQENGDSESEASEFSGWEDALYWIINDNNLTDNIDQQFVDALPEKEGLKLKGKGVVKDEMYRIVHNQLSTSKDKWSPQLIAAITTLRPGNSGVVHQVSYAKKYQLKEVRFENEDIKLLHHNEHPALIQENALY